MLSLDYINQYFYNLLVHKQNNLSFLTAQHISCHILVDLMPYKF
jgi:hypothetical protein